MFNASCKTVIRLALFAAAAWLGCYPAAGAEPNITLPGRFVPDITARTDRSLVYVDGDGVKRIRRYEDFAAAEPFMSERDAIPVARQGRYLFAIRRGEDEMMRVGWVDLDGADAEWTYATTPIRLQQVQAEVVTHLKIAGMDAKHRVFFVYAGKAYEQKEAGGVFSAMAPLPDVPDGHADPPVKATMGEDGSIWLSSFMWLGGSGKDPFLSLCKMTDGKPVRVKAPQRVSPHPMGPDYMHLGCYTHSDRQRFLNLKTLEVTKAGPFKTNRFVAAEQHVVERVSGPAGTIWMTSHSVLHNPAPRGGNTETFKKEQREGWSGKVWRYNRDGLAIVVDRYQQRRQGRVSPLVHPLPDGRCLVGCNGGGFLIIDGDKYRRLDWRYGIDMDDIRTMYVGEDFVVANQRLMRLDDLLNAEKVADNPRFKVSRVAHNLIDDWNGDVWAIEEQDREHFSRFEDGQWVRTFKVPMPAEEVLQMGFDETQRLWVFAGHTSQVVCVRNPDSWQVYHTHLEAFAAESKQGKRPLKVRMSRGGSRWLGVVKGHVMSRAVDRRTAWRSSPDLSAAVTRARENPRWGATQEDPERPFVDRRGLAWFVGRDDALHAMSRNQQASFSFKGTPLISKRILNVYALNDGGVFFSLQYAQEVTELVYFRPDFPQVEFEVSVAGTNNQVAITINPTNVPVARLTSRFRIDGGTWYSNTVVDLVQEGEHEVTVECVLNDELTLPSVVKQTVMVTGDLAGRMTRLVQQLGAREFSDRQDAEAALLGFGGASLPALVSGIGSDDVEMQFRARRVATSIITALVAAEADQDQGKATAARHTLANVAKEMMPYVESARARAQPPTARARDRIIRPRRNRRVIRQ